MKRIAGFSILTKTPVHSGHNHKSEFSNVNILIPIVDRKTWITGKRYPRNDRGQNTIMRLGTTMLAE